MSAWFARTALAMALMALTAGAASAQQRKAAAPAPGPLAEAARTADFQAVVRSGPGGGRKGAAIGAIVGASTAAVVTAWAANEYGNNEGGSFCTPCLFAWGVYSVPVGALVGAAVGGLIGHASSPQTAPRVPHTVVAPVVGRHGGAVMVRVRY
jgi:hypothetical protein